MNEKTVVCIDTKEAIISLFLQYCMDHNLFSSSGPMTKDELKRNIPIFSGAIENYLIDHYGLDLEEHVDAPVLDREKRTWILDDGRHAVCPVCNKLNGARGDFCKWCGADMRGDKE